MTFFILILSLLCYGVVAFQDFKSREISWWLFLLLYSSTFILSYYGVFGEFEKWLFIINLLCLLATGSLLSFFYLIRYQRKGLTRLTQSLGVGDLLFFPLIAYLFSTINLIGFIIVASVLSLISHLIIQLFSRIEKSIPLAGYWSILLSIIYLLSYFHIIFIKNDSFLLLWLTNLL